MDNKRTSISSAEISVATSKIISYLKNGLKTEEPELVIVSGPVASGKTTLIRKNYYLSHVWVDPCRIFFDLINLENMGALKVDELTDFIGIFTMDLAILEKRNIVVEILGTNRKKVKKIISLFTDIGYRVNVDIIKKQHLNVIITL